MKSHSDFKSHRLQKEEARKLLVRMTKREDADVTITKHAIEELTKDGFSADDAISMLESTEARILKEAEYENGSYRYRVETDEMCLIIVFDSERELTVITGWRKNEMCIL